MHHCAKEGSMQQPVGCFLELLVPTWRLSVCTRAKAGTVDRASVTKLAEEQLQAGEYEACFLTVTLLDQAEGPKDSTLQALATICSIHRSANVQDWNKV